MRKLQTVVLLLVLVVAESESQEKRGSKIRDTLGSSPVTILTKVPFNGVNYFIKIAPIDTSNIDNMPIVDPSKNWPTGGRVIIWNDSLQHMLPDSILKMLPHPKQRMK